MNQTLYVTGLLLVVFMSANELRSSESAGEPLDPFLWLEEVEGERALNWVEERNLATLELLQGDSRYESFYNTALEILNAEDRILYASYRGGWVYNFWKDAEHERGLWRRTSLEKYRAGDYDWETLLDVDALAEKEGENWVWSSLSRFSPEYRLYMVGLSRGGKDAVVRREFDADRGQFVEGGFSFPESKGSVAWESRDSLLIALDFGEGSLTESGYPRIVKRIARGQSLDEAEVLFEGKVSSVSAGGFMMERDGKEPLTGLYEATSFYTADYYLLHPHDGRLLKLPIPDSAVPTEEFNDQLVIRLRKDWVIGTAGESETYKAGSLVSFSLDEFLESGELPGLHLVYEPRERESLARGGVDRTASCVLLSLNENVTTRIVRKVFAEGEWQTEALDLPEKGSITLYSAQRESDVVFLNYESFLTPSTFMELDAATGKTRVLQRLPARFEADPYVTEQYEAISADGTAVPYFLIRRKDMPFDGSTPTYLYAYGGFQVSQTPYYSGTLGKLWLENGGAYVLANIRGGGEFGPEWHQAALKTKRQKAFDDFHAVAEDLVSRGVTRPRHLGIGGGSNGGLLVGVAMTQRPDLYQAVFCAVPLLDMLRYHLLPPGASWIAEYGDPRIPGERAALAQYSPYQALDRKTNFPEAFFYTSTKDDRVHPGHARKMAAKMEQDGHSFYYFENTEGGHAGSSNNKQLAQRLALQYVYLLRMLED